MALGADDIYIADPKRTVEVIGVVHMGILEKVQQLEQLTRSSSEPITIVINSPGGDVLMGGFFLDAMRMAQERGVRLNCVSGVLAASMAYSFLVRCDERIVLAHTRLLFHPMRVGSPMGFTSYELEAILPRMNEDESVEKHAIRMLMGMEEEAFENNYRAETLWTARDLQANTKAGFLKIVKDIRNVGPLFNIFTERDMQMLKQHGNTMPSITDVRGITELIRALNIRSLTK